MQGAAHPLHTPSCRDLGVQPSRPYAAAASLLPPDLEGAHQVNENDPARFVLVCEPLGVNNLMGALHPHGALYEKPVNVEEAARQHAAFRDAIRDAGAVCVTVKDVLMFGCDRSERARLDLERLAMRSLKYELDPATEPESLTDQERHFISDTYKVEAVEAMSVGQLVDVVFSRPTVDIRRSFRDTGFTARYRFEPLTNVLFSRDQQIVTARGVVLARMRSEQRTNEVELMRFVWQKLGIEPVGSVEAPGYLEGGDFIPARGVAFIGVGLRSNEEAVRQLCARDLWGQRTVAVVKDNFEHDQARMHLDCVFSVLSETCAIVAADVLGEDAPLRRLVDEYVLADDGDGGDAVDAACSAWGRYRKVASDVEFGAYLEQKGYSVIPVPREEQLEYACNCLNLGRDVGVLSCHHPSAKRIAKHPKFDSDIRFVPFHSVTSMYGACHCCSQVLR